MDSRPENLTTREWFSWKPPKQKRVGAKLAMWTALFVIPGSIAFIGPLTIALFLWGVIVFVWTSRYGPMPPAIAWNKLLYVIYVFPRQSGLPLIIAIGSLIGSLAILPVIWFWNNRAVRLHRIAMAAKPIDPNTWPPEPTKSSGN
jgi:hypothetical protein